jgi:hypothetical protein
MLAVNGNLKVNRMLGLNLDSALTYSICAMTQLKYPGMYRNANGDTGRRHHRWDLVNA